MNDCLFCKIVKGEIPSSKVYEDEHVIAFLDIKPVNVGHTLIVPKNHSESILEIKKEDLERCMDVMQKIAPVIQKQVNSTGINIQANCGSDAGQVIFHTHIHVIPRFSSDGLELWSSGYEYANTEMENLALLIQKSL